MNTEVFTHKKRIYVSFSFITSSTCTVALSCNIQCKTSVILHRYMVLCFIMYRYMVGAMKETDTKLLLYLIFPTSCNTLMYIFMQILHRLYG